MTRTALMSETLAETVHRPSCGQTVPRAMVVPGSRRLMAGLTAGAVALSVLLASNAPAQAEDNRDLVKALAALAVIGVVAHEIGKDRKTEREVQPVDHRRDDWRQDRREDWREDWRPPHPPRHDPKPSRRISSSCAIEIEGRDGRDVAVYAESCLRDYGIDRLPRSCARDVRFYGRHDRVYPEACLRDAGFRFGESRRRVPERPD